MSEETLLTEQEVATEETTTETSEVQNSDLQQTGDTGISKSVEGWMLAEEVKGVGEAPEWFKSGKYKTVADQAKAYAGLESKLGAFTGAPETGYVVELPEGVPEDALNQEDPLLVNFNAWAAEAGLSQEKHTELMGIYLNGMLEQQPSIEDEMKKIGKDAPQRINDFTQWAKANFDDNEMVALQNLATTAEGFNILEKMRSMQRQTDVSAPDNVKPVDSISKEAVYELVGDPRYESSPAFRKEVDEKFKKLFGTQSQNEIRQ